MQRVPGPGDSAFHAVFGGREHQFFAQGPQHAPPFKAHRLGHSQSQIVAPGRGDKRQGYARIAACRLDDFGPGRKDSALFSGLDHCPADAVLDAGKRIEELQLQKDRGVSVGNDLSEFHQRRIACRFDNVGICFFA